MQSTPTRRQPEGNCTRLHRLASLLELDGRYFTCVVCQAPGTVDRVTKGPAAVLITPTGGLVREAKIWECLACGAQGTAASLERLISEDPRWAA